MVVGVSSRVEEDLAHELEKAWELVIPSRWVHVLVFELRPNEASVHAEKLRAVIVRELDHFFVPTNGNDLRAFRELPRVVVIPHVASSAAVGIELLKILSSL